MHQSSEVNKGSFFWAIVLIFVLVVAGIMTAILLLLYNAVRKPLSVTSSITWDSVLRFIFPPRQKELALVCCLVVFACDGVTFEAALGNGFISTPRNKRVVNLHMHVNSPHAISSSLPDSTPVDILNISNDFYFVRSKVDKRKEGYCHKSMVEDVEWD